MKPYRCSGLWLVVLTAGIAVAQPGRASLTEPAGPVPAANALVLEETQEVELREDGAITTKIHRRVKILTKEGADLYRDESFLFDGRLGKVEVESVRVLQPDGKFKAAANASVEEVAHPETRSFTEDYRLLQVRVTGLQPQEVLETSILSRSKSPLGKHYNELFVFQYDNPVLFKQVIIRCPAGRGLRFVVREGQLEYARQEIEGMVEHRWTGRDLPALNREYGMIPLEFAAIRLLVSTVPDWPELSRLGCQQSETVLRPDAAISEQAQKLVQGITQPESRIMTLYRWVSSEIRYLSAPAALGMFHPPRPPAVILASRWASGREKALLLTALLRSLEFSVQEVFANTSGEPDPEMPSVYFESALCAVDLQDGRRLFLDPAMEGITSLGETYTGDRQVLPLSAAGETLFTVPHSPASRSRGIITARSVLQPDGRVISQVNLEGTGYYDYLLRSVGRSRAELKFVRFWQERARELLPAAKVSGMNASSPLDLIKPFQTGFQLELPDYAIPAGDFLLLAAPLSRNTFEVYGLGLFKMVTGQERRYPLQLFSTVKVKQQETITIPPGWEIFSLPGLLQVTEGPFSLRTGYSGQEGAIIFESEFVCERSLIPPADFAGLHRLITRWREHQRGMIVLRKKSASGGGS